MSFANKLFFLAIVAYVHASARISRAEGEGGNVWSKFLGKVPEYFKGPENVDQLQTSDQAAAAGATSDVQNDEIANDGESTSYPNSGQLTENKWQEKFTQCVTSFQQVSSSSGTGSGGSSGGSGGSSGQYGPDSFSNYGNSEAYQKHIENCRKQIPSSVSGQDFFSQYHPPQMPSNFGSYTGALTGSSPSSSGSSSASA